MEFLVLQLTHQVMHQNRVTNHPNTAPPARVPTMRRRPELPSASPGGERHSRPEHREDREDPAHRGDCGGSAVERGSREEFDADASGRVGLRICREVLPCQLSGGLKHMEG